MTNELYRIVALLIIFSPFIVLGILMLKYIEKSGFHKLGSLVQILLCVGIVLIPINLLISLLLFIFTALVYLIRNKKNNVQN